MFVAVACVLVAYLLGTLPSAVWIGRRAGRDPTNEGSGNPGASNVFRTVGARAGALVYALDAGKGVVATLLGLAVGGRPLAVACWAAATVGHIAPVTRRFRGGKGVATSGGGALVLYPVIWLVLAVVFAVTLRLTRTAAVGSLTITVGFVAAVALTGRPGWEIGAAAGVAALVVVRHRSNIARLRAGREPSYRGVPEDSGRARQGEDTA